MHGGFLLYLREKIFLSDHGYDKRTYHHIQYEDYIYCFLFLPYMPFLIAKASLMATFDHEKKVKDIIKKHATHIRLGNVELMKYKP